VANAVRSTGIDGVIQPGACIELVKTGFDFTEGPIWHSGEQSLIFSDILGNSIYSWSEFAGLKTLRLNSYMANGNAYDQQGRILTCEHATSRLTRTDFANGGEYEVLASHYQGRELNSPNDVVVKRDGTIYFTDPTSGRSDGFGIPREPELIFSGVFRLEPESGNLTLLIDDFAKPNGLCFSRDELLLFVNDTVRQHIRVFDVLPDGGIENGRLFADLTGQSGELLGVIETPEFAANFVFGDADQQTLYITASTSLYRVRVDVPGVATFTPST